MRAANGVVETLRIGRRPGRALERGTHDVRWKLVELLERREHLLARELVERVDDRAGALDEAVFRADRQLELRGALGQRPGGRDPVGLHAAILDHSSLGHVFLGLAGTTLLGFVGHIGAHATRKSGHAWMV